MAPKELTGILCALITPFTPDGKSIDAAALDTHINRLIKAGIHGLVPGGSTGEFTTLTHAERKQLLELTIKSAAGRVPVVAGIGALSTTEALDLASHAAAAGADALMVVPPFYDALSVPLLRAYFAEIRDAAGGGELPIMYYNIPAASGTKLTPAELAGLADVGVRYLKDTSGDAPALTELLFGLHDRITAFNGWDTLTFYGLAAGAKGSVWGAANVVPELCARLWEAVAVRGDLREGRALWAKIWPVCKFLESHNYAAAVKTGVELVGGKTGGLRKPFAPLEEVHRKEFGGLLRAAGVQVVE